jgi:hypothetical protein
MLEWNPRLAALVIGLVTLALTLGYEFLPGNFGWGSW